MGQKHKTCVFLSPCICYGKSSPKPALQLFLYHCQRHTNLSKAICYRKVPRAAGMAINAPLCEIIILLAISDEYKKKSQKYSHGMNTFLVTLYLQLKIRSITFNQLVSKCHDATYTPECETSALFLCRRSTVCRVKRIDFLAPAYFLKATASFQGQRQNQ